RLRKEFALLSDRTGTPILPGVSATPRPLDGGRVRRCDGPANRRCPVLGDGAARRGEKAGPTAPRSPIPSDLRQPGGTRNYSFNLRTLTRSATMGCRSSPRLDGGARKSVRSSEKALVITRVLDPPGAGDRKSTRLNSSHVKISYAVFCL